MDVPHSPHLRSIHSWGPGKTTWSRNFSSVWILLRLHACFPNSCVCVCVCVFQCVCSFGCVWVGGHIRVGDREWVLVALSINTLGNKYQFFSCQSEFLPRDQEEFHSDSSVWSCECWVVVSATQPLSGALDATSLGYSWWVEVFHFSTRLKLTSSFRLSTFTHWVRLTLRPCANGPSLGRNTHCRVWPLQCEQAPASFNCDHRSIHVILSRTPAPINRNSWIIFPKRDVKHLSQRSLALWEICCENVKIHVTFVHTGETFTLMLPNWNLIIVISLVSNILCLLTWAISISNRMWNKPLDRGAGWERDLGRRWCCVRPSVLNKDVFCKLSPTQERSTVCTQCRSWGAPLKSPCVHPWAVYQNDVLHGQLEGRVFLRAWWSRSELLLRSANNDATIEWKSR